MLDLVYIVLSFALLPLAEFVGCAVFVVIGAILLRYAAAPFGLGTGNRGSSPAARSVLAIAGAISIVVGAAIGIHLAGMLVEIMASPK